MTCSDFQARISDLLAGTAAPADVDALRRHAEGCPTCRAAWDELDRTGALVREAFAADTSAVLARQRLLAQLPTEQHVPARRPRLPRFILRGALAASILLAVGLGGFAAGRMHTAPPVAASAPPIDVRVATVDGTVLVKRAHQPHWQALSPGDTLCLGDLLQSAGKSAATLALWDNSSITIQAATTLSADAFDGKVEFALRSGTIQASLQSAHPPFFIRTPQGTLEALGTEFVVKVD